MTKMKISARLAAPLLLAALAACDDNPAGSGGTPVSNVHVVYGGSNNQGTTVDGTYEARGEARAGTAPILQTYALGQRFADDGHILVLSNVKHGGADVADFTWITIPRLTEGSVAIDGICPGENCAAVSLALEVGTVGVSQAKYSCSLDAGTIRVRAVTETRVKGDFSGTGFCIGAPGTADLDQFSIAEGTFDVVLIDAAG